MGRIRADGAVVNISDVYDKLKNFPWDKYGVYYAVLFGSLAKRGVGHDVDVAVEMENYSLKTYSDLLIDMADALNIHEDLLDLLVVTDNLSCYLVHEALGGSKIIYIKDSHSRELMIRRLLICNDFLMDSRKLGLVDTMVKVVMDRWHY